VVNNIIREALLNDMSDIHLEPRPDKVVVRVRKDGSLREYMTMPKATAGALAARIKIMGGLNIAERRMPQDGRVRFKDKSTEVDLRLSTLPTVYGEKCVMRLLKKAASIPEIEQLGFADYNFQRFTDVIQKPYGMFLITGPTGSGKSFTTFSILKRVATPDVNVSTVEDPVEYEIPGINQTQVNVKAGLDFARALRAFLRQDPDIIMVGEIRDHETAKISMEAALTGHLLIATLHTNDAAGAVVRLTEMGIEPFNVSASLIGVLAQRLVRKVCKECRVEYTPEETCCGGSGCKPDEVRGRKLFRGVGCEKCGGSGYNGRYAIHELLIVDDTMENAIVREAVGARDPQDLAIATACDAAARRRPTRPSRASRRSKRCWRPHRRMTATQREEPACPIRSARPRQQVDIVDLLRLAMERRASDLVLTVGLPPMLKIDGEWRPTEHDPLTPNITRRLMYSMMDEKKQRNFEERKDLDFSFSLSGQGRFRVNCFQQRNSVGGVLRTISEDVITFEQLGVPKELIDIARLPRGLVLVTGPTGSGKSTTLATMIDLINASRPSTS
jgi:type II secretory ATPase GspE/PulE/Tfp pilus assembly ATPase PilB-like protein